MRVGVDEKATETGPGALSESRLQVEGLERQGRKRMIAYHGQLAIKADADADADADVVARQLARSKQADKLIELMAAAPLAVCA